MGKLIAIISSVWLIGCANTSYYSFTGHGDQSEQIERTFQHALEFNKDGLASHWHDKNTGKSGTVTPKYASYKYQAPCRHFEIAYFNPSKYYHGIACRHGQSWQIH